MRGKMGWQDLGGEYLHFTLYKENKDTMEVVSFLASQLKLHTRNIQFSGTKDRRAVTVQRMSVYRLREDRLAGLGRNLRNAKIGGFKYESYPLKLGDLKGNEFVITLRECHFPGEEGLGMTEKEKLAQRIVADGVKSLGERGFINFYGLQRFGSFQTSTDKIGMKLLQGDIEAAIKIILEYSPTVLSAAKGEFETNDIASDDRKRALAIHTWEETGDTEEACNILPRKFGAERSIIRFLGHGKGGHRSNAKNWQGAVESIQRNLRLMYVHAYQSLVWNTVASERWKRYGSKVVEGDLVIKDTADEQGSEDEVDESGEIIVRPSNNDRVAGDDTFVRARPLTAEDVASGKYTILDVVLALPGFDVIYPHNDIGQFYKDFMASEAGGGLDPHKMRRAWKDINLSGGYRKFLSKPKSISGYVKKYADQTEQLIETDLDRIQKANQSSNDVAEPRKDDEQKDKLAVILKLQLGSSQYATMALRELLKDGGVQAYKAEFGKEP
jgi:tRNA pseudouridine13 synthase